MFIDGKPVPAKGGGYFPVENPATGETAAEVAEGKSKDIKWAVEVGKKAFRDGRWSRMEPRQRAHSESRGAVPGGRRERAGGNRNGFYRPPARWIFRVAWTRTRPSATAG